MPCPQCPTPSEKSNTACHSCGAGSPRDPLIGQTIAERYQLLHQIGAGACGVVYAAEHLSLQSKVAVKVLHGSLARDAVIAERFRREALVMSKLTHPHAVKLFDRGETPEGTLWFSMELLDGETLSARLERRELFSERELVKLFESICEVLEEAHQQGIIHRDLKPANIVLVRGLGGATLAKLLDFGISDLKSAKELTHPKLVSGTPTYMAPEQWRGLSFADARSDVYSLGVIAYQCLSGKLPLDADSPLAWLKKHQSEQPIDLQVALERPIAEAFAQAVMSAIAKDPEARPQSAAALYKSLKAGLSQKSNTRHARKSAIASTKKEISRETHSITVQEVPPKKQRSFLRIGFAGAILLSGLVAALLLMSSFSVAEPLQPRQAVISVTPTSAPTLLVPVSLPSRAPINEPLTVVNEPKPVPQEPASAPILVKKQSQKGEVAEELLKTDQSTLNPWNEVKSKKSATSLPTSKDTINPWVTP